MVVRAQERNNGLTRLATVVMRNRREKMMHNIITRDMLREMRPGDAKNLDQ